MINSIGKNNPNRWYISQNSGSGETSIIAFGNAGLVGINELITGQPILLDYLTEDELEIKVNDVSGIADYYKDAVENESLKFQMPSEKYLN